MKRFIKWIGVVVISTVVLFAGIYIYAVNSEPFRFSERWVRTSPEVRERVGVVKETSISVIGDFSDEIRGDARIARVSTLVRGEKGKVRANLWLEKRGTSEWVVSRCQFDVI